MIQITHAIARDFFPRNSVHESRSELGTVSNRYSSGFELRAQNADLLPKFAGLTIRAEAQ
jgi:hypothetical protein